MWKLSCVDRIARLLLSPPPVPQGTHASCSTNKHCETIWTSANTPPISCGLCFITFMDNSEANHDMENVDKKVGIAKEPQLPRQVFRLTQKVKSKWVGETDYCCPGENKIPTFPWNTSVETQTENIWSRNDKPQKMYQKEKQGRQQWCATVCTRTIVLSRPPVGQITTSKIWFLSSF